MQLAFLFLVVFLVLNVIPGVCLDWVGSVGKTPQEACELTFEE